MKKIRRFVLTVALGALVAGVTVFAPPGLGPADAKGQDMAPELSPNLGWLNTDRPLRLAEELKGHVVVLDFWTYCCINCMHILPDLEFLEDKYKDDPVVVIGVHSAKFANEGERQSIRNAVHRYGVRHPVVIDDRMKIWERYGVSSWPTFVVIGTDGCVIGHTTGEGKRDILDRSIQLALREGRARGTVAAARVPINPDATVPSATGLAFPGKVLGVAPRPGNGAAGGFWSSGALFIADSSHHRVIAVTWPDAQGRAELVRAYGEGTAGLADGPAASARFHDPQGLALDEARGVLYVADTKNHAIREIDLMTGTVSTLVGNGEQSYDRAGGGAGANQGLSSPWDVVLSRDGATLFVAMAGTHQLWKVDLASRVARALAGSGYENIIDGPAPEAALAQPSGLALASDGSRLYFADSEVSAVRYVNLAENTVHTIVGVGLFDFGDVDGSYPDARLQHCLGVAVWPTDMGDRVLVADTYNHKVKYIDPDMRLVGSWLGAGRGQAAAPDDLRLDEPGGVSLASGADRASLFIADTNNHRVIAADMKTRSWHEVMIAGLEPTSDTQLTGATAVEVAAAPGRALTLLLRVDLAPGTHPNTEAPTTARVSVEGEPAGRVVAQRTARIGAFPFTVEVPGSTVVSGARLLVELTFASCSDGDAGICVPGSAAWIITIKEGTHTETELRGNPATR
jgi:sugar lactone lactonase YvrE/thiol-disulfide isomerase/thioredoxin